MNKKIIIIMLVSILVCTTMIKTASAVHIEGVFGRYFEFEVDVVDLSGHMEIAKNDSVGIIVTCANSQILYLKSLQLEADIEGVQIVNETLRQNYNMTLTAGSSGGFADEVDFTPNRTGYFSITLVADYEYTDGNQTFEQGSRYWMLNLFSINDPTYGDLANQNSNLEGEINNLNTTNQNLNTSYHQLQVWTWVLAGTTALFILISAFALVRNYKPKKPIEHSQTTTA